MTRLVCCTIGMIAGFIAGFINATHHVDEIRTTDLQTKFEWAASRLEAGDVKICVDKPDVSIRHPGKRLSLLVIDTRRVGNETEYIRYNLIVPDLSYLGEVMIEAIGGTPVKIRATKAQEVM